MCVILLFVLPLLTVLGEETATTAQRILDRSGTKGGLVVVVGCGDPGLLTELRANDSYLVQGLETDAGRVEKARGHIRSAGLYGPVSADTFDGERLPYIDNMVNLLVTRDARCEIRGGEVARVLAPLGTAIGPDGASCIPHPATRIGNGLVAFTKPVPPDIDDWPHYLHGPGNNAVAQDSVVGPPHRMQWVGGPAFARSHEINSSMAAMVTSGGRLFYVWDEGPCGMTDKRFPERWKLIARDAFNGLVLWKRPMRQWGWRQWHPTSRWKDARERAKMLRMLPATSPRRLVAVGDKVYVTLGYEAPVSVLDGATGRTLDAVKGTDRTDEILCDGGLLVLRGREPDSPPDKNVWGTIEQQARARIVVVDMRTDRTLWKSKPDAMAPLTLASRNGRVFYSDYSRIVCLDAMTGREIWRSGEVAGKVGNRGTVGTLVAHDEVVLFASYPAKNIEGSGRLLALSADTGKVLWRGPRYTGPGITNPPDLFVADDLVWVGETKLPVSHAHIELRRQGFDPLTGKVMREVVVPKLISWGHHYRCYRSKATERFLMLPKRGVEFVDLQGKGHMRNDWLRAPCIYGMLPANGLLYVAPHQCVCYPGVLMKNFNALAPKAKSETPQVRESERLEKGPAYGSPIRHSTFGSRQSEDWPTYRRDARRSGGTPMKLGDRLAEKWRTRLDSGVTPPVVAGGLLLVAAKDTHTVHALDAESGKRVWGFTAGGRVDSPPTVQDGLVLFGAADGRVYCLRLKDGREVWRFLAAPSDGRLAAFGQIESVWPVHGSVLVEQDRTVNPPRDVAYFTAGRSSFLDGGIRVYGLDPRKGEILHETPLEGPRSDPFKEKGTAGYKDGSKSDLLVSDGGDIFLFQERFRTDLTRVPAPMQNMGKEGGGFRIYPPSQERGSSGIRLITTHGFLDDNYNEGKYWTYGNRWPGWDRKMRQIPAYGQLLTFDEKALYGVHVFTESIRVRRGRTLGGKGERLFARNHGSKQDRWSIHVPIQVRAMVLAGDKLFIAGPPDRFPDEDPLASVEGRLGAVLWAVSAVDGKKLFEHKLESLPVFDGMIAANGCLYLCTRDGEVVCLGDEKE